MKAILILAAAVALLASPAIAGPGDNPYATGIKCNTTAFGSTCFDRNRNVAPLPSGDYFANTESAEAIRLMQVSADCSNFTGFMPPTRNPELAARFAACRK